MAIEYWNMSQYEIEQFVRDRNPEAYEVDANI